jgi:hypothetical protein
MAYDAADNPELMLTLSIYHAAHITYLSQLEMAIKRNKDISEEERDNASAVFKVPFVQFKDFLIFATLAMLILYEKRRMPPEKTERKSKDEIMKDAITAGWKTFFEYNLIRHNYSEVFGTPEKGSTLRMVCPASNHLWVTKQQSTLETLYDAVVQHREQLKPLLDKVERVTKEAVYSSSLPPSSPWSRG